MQHPGMRGGVWMWTLILLTGCGEELTVIIDGKGQVTSNPPGIACPAACTTKVEAGSQVELTARPAPGSVFSSWIGDCQAETATCTFTVDGPRTVIAKMAALHRLDVTVPEPGGVEVTSEPPGISCGEKCRAEFPVGTKVVLRTRAETGTRVSGFSGACEGTTCTVTISKAAQVKVLTEEIPGTLLSAERIDDDAGGALDVDPDGNLLWAHEGSIETYGLDGKRLQRASLGEAGIEAVKSISARSTETTVVGGRGEEGSLVAALKRGGRTAWSTALPGEIAAVRAWRGGVVAACVIDGRVTLGERKYGKAKRPNILLAWLDTEGKITDGATLGVRPAEVLSMAVDRRGAAAVITTSGKKHVLFQVAGSQGQRWKLPLGRLEHATVRSEPSGKIWVAGSALSVEDELKSVGIERDDAAQCDDAGFGFLVAVDPGGTPVAGKSWGRAFSDSALDTERLSVAGEFVGNVSTATGAFTSTGFAAKLRDCDDVCGEQCGSDHPPGPCSQCKATCDADAEKLEAEALCATEPDVLIGALDENMKFLWARHLSAEGSVSVLGVSRRGRVTTAVVSVGERVRVLGGQRETSLPSGVSVIRFR